jgi:hypothetical protein
MTRRVVVESIQRSMFRKLVGNGKTISRNPGKVKMDIQCTVDIGALAFDDIKDPYR